MPISDVIDIGSCSYVTIDNLELAHVTSSGNYGYGLVSGGAPSFLTLSNMYLHGWRTSNSSDDAHGGVIMGSYSPNVQTFVIDNTEIENSENSTRWNGVMVRMGGTIRNSYLHDNSSAVLFALDFDHNVMTNVCYPQCGFDGSYHFNGVYLDAETLGKNVAYIRNSVFYNNYGAHAASAGALAPTAITPSAAGRSGSGSRQLTGTTRYETKRKHHKTQPRPGPGLFVSILSRRTIA